MVFGFSTPLVARTDERATLSAWLDAAPGLITIVGPAGVGKTRLAVELCGARRHVYCAVGDAPSLGELRRLVAKELGSEMPSNGGDATLAHMLATKAGAMLVLDNCETVSAFVSELTMGLLRATPELRVVATSREPLRVPGERLLDLAPLALPAPGENPLASPAVQLWIDSVRRGVAGYSPSGQELELVAQIVRALDGLPLAIELAAPRMRIFDASALLEQLRERFKVLRRAQSSDPRHDTLLGAIESSWAALTPGERLALSVLSVFRESFTTKCAASILERIDVGEDPLDVIQSLRDRSLLAMAQQTPVVRLRAYQSVRDFARERTDEALRQRAKDAFVLEMGAFARSERGDGPSLQAVLERENLLDTVGIVGSMKAPSVQALDAALDARFLLHQDGMQRHTRRDQTMAMLDRARERFGELRPRSQALVRHFEGLLRPDLGASDESAIMEALSLAEQAGEWQIAAAAGRLGIIAHAFGNNRGKVEALITRLRAMAPHLGAISQANNEANIGFAATSVGLEVNVVNVLAAIARLRDAPGAVFPNVAVNALLALTDLGYYDAALQIGREAIERLRPLGRLDAIGAAEARLGDVAVELGDFHAAEAHYLEAQRMGALAYGDAITDTFVPFALAKQGMSLAERGEYFAALDCHLRATAGMTLPASRVSVLCWRVWLLAAVGLAQESEELANALRVDAERVPAERERVELAVAYASELSGGSNPERVDVALAAVDAIAGRSSMMRRFARVIRKDRARRAEASRAEHEQSWVVEQNGNGFKGLDGVPVSLASQPLLGRLLVELAKARLTAKGSYVPAAKLIAAGWPGERMSDRSAAERLRAAAKRLRRAGLETVLESGQGGYRISPAAVVRLVDAPGDFSE